MAQLLAEWLRKRGAFVSPKLDLFATLDSDSGGRGVVAREPLSEGDQLLLIPVEATLHVPPPDASDVSGYCPAAQYVHQQHPGLSPFLATTLTLMAEMAAGAASEHAAYIGTLPQAADSIVLWVPEDLQLLRGTSIEFQGRTAEQIYQQEVAPRIAARPDLWPQGACGVQHFKRAADMVQSRAFHMTPGSEAAAGGEQEGGTLYMIPGVDQLNHSSDPARRNTHLVRCDTAMSIEVDGKEVQFSGFFSMKAGRDIPAGAEVVHSYGDLSDAQMLQTYGFVERFGGPNSSCTSNPFNYAKVPWQALKVAAAALGVGPQGKGAAKLLAQIESFLHSADLLAADPAASFFAVTASDPLPSDLLTGAQVLLMLPEEFAQLQQAHQQQVADRSQAAALAAAASVASASEAAGSSAGQSTAAVDQASKGGLDLGTDLLQSSGEFAEMVGALLTQAIGSCLARYPDTVAEVEAQAGSRAWRAQQVAAGEKAVLQAAKRAALVVMMQGAEAAGDDSDEEYSEAEEDEGQQQPGSKRPQAGEGSGGSGDEQPKRAKHAGLGSEDLHKELKHEKRVAHKARSHYGELTGPREEDVWESDDSDKVGYTDSQGRASPGECKRQQSGLPVGQEHLYEEDGDGHTRERFGDMVGPDEEALIASDDSGQVGYA